MQMFNAIIPKLFQASFVIAQLDQRPPQLTGIDSARVGLASTADKAAVVTDTRGKIVGPDQTPVLNLHARCTRMMNVL
jgi:hypothetical protein